MTARSLRPIGVSLVAAVVLVTAATRCQGRVDSAASTFEALPILSYDTDTGFGYGAKAFLLNSLGWNESFDALAFQSSKGERWYRIVFSVPDFEVRQGSVYPLAVDLIVDYDRWIAYNYFGMGSGSRFEDRQIFTREPLEASLLFSRGWSEFVAQVGLRGRRIVNRGLRGDPSRGDAEDGTVNALGILFSCRYDSRDSYIAPTRGTVAQVECEVAPQVLWSSVRYIRWALWGYHFVPVEFLHSVLACRAGMEVLSGEGLPMQVMVSLGGGNSVRGSLIGRFVDRCGAVANLEWRIPLVWRFGAVLGCDAGKVWPSVGAFDLRAWAFNAVAGLRFSMETFVVRADVGFGRESTGFYLNFGHLF